VKQVSSATHESNEKNANRLVSPKSMTRQAVTKHLAVLEEANRVVVIWRGREKLRYCNPVPIHEIAER